ncbi:MAG TPA: YceI family protein [Salinimicrobium sp.]|nr:YceI family protein [Salinimicrobium sp.]
MKTVYSFILFAFLSTGVFAQTTWTADKAHSQLSFGITHLGISEVEGLFDKFDATIVASEEDFSDAEVEVVVDVNSINTGVEMRDNHLRSADFFDVENHGKMTFSSDSIVQTGENKYQLFGDLTLHGITKPVTLDMWYRGTLKQEKGPVSGFQVTGTIKRSDFNVGNGFPEAALSDEVRIKFDGEFKPKKETVKE